MRVLHINASPRNEKSVSLKISEQIIVELKKRRSISVDEFNLFEDELPPFDHHAVGAKMAVFASANATPEQQAAWRSAQKVFERFAQADVYVLNVPLWNGGIPYRLKQFIDVVTQPGWAFGFDVEHGYTGLLAGKRAYIVHASGVYYEGIPHGFGSDFSTPYLDDWFRFIGLEEVHHLHVAPTIVNSDVAKTIADAEAKAVMVAQLGILR